MDIPLIEFDTHEGLISPDFEKLPLTLPKRCLMAFFGERRVREFAESKGGKKIGAFQSITKEFPLYEIPGKKEPLLLMEAPVGAPAAVLMEERLFAYGVEKVLAIGCAGSLIHLPESSFYPVQRALRDEGTSFHYLPPARFIDFDGKPLEHLRAWFEERQMPFHPVTTWTSDGFFRETKEKIKRRIGEGCTLVDMEASGLAACARFRKKEYAQILFTADSLANFSHNQRNWGYKGRTLALVLGMDALEVI